MPSSIDRKTVELLLAILGSPTGKIAGAVLSDYHARHSAQLLTANLLEPCGHAAAAASLADHDDEPISLTWSAERKGYGYFSSPAGWVSVPAERLVLYQVSFEKLFSRIVADLDLPRGATCRALIPNLLWEAGDVRLPGRGRRVPLWIGRRLGDPDAWKRFAEVIRLRPAPGLRILLSLTPAKHLSAQIHQGHEIISVQDVAGHDGLAVDPALLAARVASGGHMGNQAIIMAADGAAISVRGKRYVFSGSKQRSIIRQLHDALQSGTAECLTAEVLESAGFKTSVNTLAKAFSKRVDWREFIAEENGRCWIFL